MVRKRNPFVAALLSLIPGLGQIYNGQLTKGLIFFLIDLLIPIFVGLTRILLTFHGLIATLAISIMFILYVIIDGFTTAKKLKTYELRKYNNWLSYYLFAMTVGAIGALLGTPALIGIQTFKISSPSMIPTLQPGDRVVSQLNAYKKSKIGYGDIVAFNSPKGGIWTFRVMGLPGDSIEIIDGYFYINGQPNEMRRGQESISDNQEVIEFEEQLTNDQKIRTLRFKNNSFPEAQTMPKKLIPENEYFLMGDNRDNAFDSRFIGTVKQGDILGKLLYSYWGYSSDRINIDLRLE